MHDSSLTATMHVPQAPCPCKDPRLCKPIQKHNAKEVLGWHYPASKNFKYYDWSQLTSVAWSDDPELMCMAHAHGARVIKNAGDVTHVLGNETAMQEWVGDGGMVWMQGVWGLKCDGMPVILLFLPPCPPASGTVHPRGCSYHTSISASSHV